MLFVPFCGYLDLNAIVRVEYASAVCHLVAGARHYSGGGRSSYSFLPQLW